MRSARRITVGVAALGWVPTLLVVGLHWADESYAAAQERTPIKVTRPRPNCWAMTSGRS